MRGKYANHYIGKKASTAFMRIPLWILVAILLLLPVSAYTGAFAIFPPAPGPDYPFTQRLDVDTNTQNPDVIDVGGEVIESITITTDEPIRQSLILQERPAGQGPTFSISAPMILQKVLVEATITFWAPEQETLTIVHDHAGDEPYEEQATKIQPTQTDGKGNILWTMTVDSFSTFYAQEPSRRTMPWNAILLVSILSSSCLLIRP